VTSQFFFRGLCLPLSFVVHFAEHSESGMPKIIRQIAHFERYGHALLRRIAIEKGKLKDALPVSAVTEKKCCDSVIVHREGVARLEVRESVDISGSGR
jgi:hypothetical protein